MCKSKKRAASYFREGISAAIVAASLFLCAVHLPAVAQSRSFTADSLPNIVRISDPQISPDGTTIAYVASHANLKDDRWESDIEVVDVISKKVRIMTRERVGASMPRWSPGGDSLAYLAQDAEKKVQIFVLTLDSGDSVQITQSKTNIKALAWRPDGTALAFAASDEEPERKGEARFEDAFEVGNNDFLERSRLTPTHLWMVSLAQGITEHNEITRLTSGDWSLPNFFAGGGSLSISFTPDGTNIIFVRAETSLTGDTDTGRVAILNLATGTTRRLTRSSIEEDDPTVSADGGRVAYLSPREAKRQNETSVFVASTNGSVGVDAAFSLDRSISAAAWLPDSQALVVAVTNQTREELWLQPLNGRASRIDIGGLNLVVPTPAMSVGKSGGLVFAAATADRPAELFYMKNIGDVPVQMTHLQTVTDGMVLGKSEPIAWQCDQFKEQGVLTYPPGYVKGKKYPLVLYIHGGPEAASVEGFFAAAELLASQGWLVFRPNYRGSNSNGNAYEAAISGDAGLGPGHDVMAGISAIEALGVVDEKRIAVTGWSYGGFMTSWLIGNYPSVWRTAIAGAPVTDLMDQYTASDITWFAYDVFGASPYIGDGSKRYISQSPITYAWRAKTPTLILADSGDYRVPITQSFKLYHALKDNGVPVKFFIYPVNGHSPADPIRARDVFRRWTAWLRQYLNDGSAN